MHSQTSNSRRKPDKEDTASTSSDDNSNSLYTRSIRGPEDYNPLWLGVVQVAQAQRGKEGHTFAESLINATGGSAATYMLLVSVEALLLYTITPEKAAARSASTGALSSLVSSRSGGPGRAASHAPPEGTGTPTASGGGSEDSRGSSGAHDQLFCATVPFVQITDVHRNGQHISVQYTPNVLKRATKRDLVKQFLTPAKKSSQRRATKGAAAPGQEGSNRLDIVCNSAAEAAELAAALGAALERFCGTMEYLDTTLPPPDGKTYVEVVTLEPTGGQADGGVGEAEAVWLVARQPAWGQEMIVPVCEFTMSHRPAALHLYLHTPLGPACAVVPPSTLRAALTSSRHQDAVVEATAALGGVQEPHLWPGEAPGYSFEAVLRCRVVPHGDGGERAAAVQPVGRASSMSYAQALQHLVRGVTDGM